LKKDNYLLPSAKRTYSKSFDPKQLKRDVSWKLDIAGKQKLLAKRLLKNRLSLKICPACKKNKFSLFANIFEYPYNQCLNCGHIFSAKPPKPEYVKKLYTALDKKNKAVQSQIYAVKGLFKIRVKNIAKPKVEFVTKNLPSKGKWVDVGCGTGEIVYAAQALGWKALGIESDASETNFAKKMGINLVNTFITEDNSSDYISDAQVVSLFNILEHIIDPLELLKSLAKKVPQGCRFVIEVPRHPSLSSFANRAFPEMACRHIYSPDHLHAFTEKSIELILKKSGLNAQHIWLFGQDFYEVISSISALKNIKNNSLFETILQSSEKIQNEIDKNNLSDSMLIIAKKE